MDFNKLHNNEKIREHAIAELTAIGGVIKGEEIVILCPFHDDSTPSLGVHIGHKVTPGTYNCFACPAKGSWNDLARALKMQPIQFQSKGKQTGAKENVDDDDEINEFQLMLDEWNRLEKKQHQQPKKLHGIEELPEDFSWRGYPRSLYERLGASYYWTEDIQSIHFPLTTWGQYNGYTLCTVHSDTPKFKKYLVFAEATKNLFLYDHLKSKEPIIITEGHFDAIRLMGEGFNATAIFGVQNWSDYKRDLIIAKIPPRVVIVFDGDNPGYEASVKVFDSLRDFVDVDILYLPLKDKKLDPGNMPGEYLTLLRGKADGISQ